jgi:hypothetical protein
VKNKKIPLALKLGLAVLLISAFCLSPLPGHVLALLTASPPPITNEFTPGVIEAKVNTEKPIPPPTPNISGDAKTYSWDQPFTVKNENAGLPNAIDAYFRVQILPEFTGILLTAPDSTPASGDVLSWAMSIDGTCKMELASGWDSDWYYDADDGGWFYYRDVVAPGVTIDGPLQTITIHSDDANKIDYYQIFDLTILAEGVMAANDGPTLAGWPAPPP